MGRMQQEGSREMENGGMNTIMPHSHSSQALLEELHHQQQNGQQPYDDSQNSQQHDDFMEQMLSNISTCPWPSHPNDNPSAALKSSDSPPDDHATFQYPFDEASLASKLQQHQQIGNGAAAKSMLLQQQQQQHFLLSRGLRPPLDAGMIPLPLSLSGADPADAPPSNFAPTQLRGGRDPSVQALFNGFTGSLHGNGQPPNQPQFHAPPPQNCGGPAGAAGNLAPPASASTGGSSGAAPQRQRVRARRGQATDPHSIAERLRRERIAERMKALQELVPNANKTDKASMLDEIIDYVKFLQLQVKVLSMSRLGGAGAVGPMVADMSSEGGGSGVGRSNSGIPSAAGNENMSVSEHQVAKLMEEDMGSAMQYLQGKGLCLMPISLATAISTATCQSRNPLAPSRALLNPNIGNNINSSMSGLTVQGTAPVANGTPAADEPAAKDGSKL